MSAITCSHALIALQQHIGSEHGISAKALAERLGVEPRRLRHLITELREEGVAVCGVPETGYYIAETAAELDRCCAFLRSRAMHSLTLESKLRNLPLQDLLGQLRLPT